MPILELCAGYGGLGMAVEELTGDKVAYVAEVDEAASKVLAHRFPDVPNIGDITAYDWTQLEGLVDIITAGFPCQDISNAGKRKGIEGERSGIWKNVCEAVGILRPRLLFLENVAAIRGRGLSTVAEDLAAVGYDLLWTTLRASEVGPPHQRPRWFGLAVPAISDAQGVGRAARRTQSEELEGAVRRSSGDGRQLPSNSHSSGLEVRGLEPTREEFSSSERGGSSPEDSHSESGAERSCAAPREKEGGGHGPTLNDEVSFLLPYSDSIGRNGGTGTQPEPEGRDEPEDARYSPAEWWGEYLPAVRRWEYLIGRPAPAPTELGPRGGRRLTARFAEWMMGLEDGWVTDVPGLKRSDQLHKIGNGVVPQQAYAAFSHLLSQVALMKEVAIEATHVGH
ncbi:DNA cytosine methyltransferase [Streptomyces sp. NPDC006355]|uniref:DNA cytosine methyltransferase n=1 Tax=Streptomyces sp. NPDC006355 TaxID=3156758 RepID=UPI0033B532FF